MYLHIYTLNELNEQIKNKRLSKISETPVVFYLY